MRSNYVEHYNIWSVEYYLRNKRTGKVREETIMLDSEEFAILQAKHMVNTEQTGMAWVFRLGRMECGIVGADPTTVITITKRSIDTEAVVC